MNAIDTVRKIMTEFADSTGLSGAETSPRRYLWTDAFAVCNFIELYRQTKAEDWQRLPCCWSIRFIPYWVATVRTTFGPDGSAVSVKTRAGGIRLPGGSESENGSTSVGLMIPSIRIWNGIGTGNTTIEKFWLEIRSKKSQSWAEHRDINNVMLATSLMPDGYLAL